MCILIEINSYIVSKAGMDHMCIWSNPTCWPLHHDFSDLLKWANSLTARYKDTQA
jgi:hypothetical protein